MRALLPLLAVALFGCGNSQNNSGEAGDSFAKSVAASFDKDCRSANAPNPKAAKELDQLCSCMQKKLLSTVQDGDSNDRVNQVIDEGRDACIKEVYPND